MLLKKSKSQKKLRQRNTKKVDPKLDTMELTLSCGMLKRKEVDGTNAILERRQMVNTGLIMQMMANGSQRNSMLPSLALQNLILLSMILLLFITIKEISLSKDNTLEIAQKRKMEN